MRDDSVSKSKRRLSGRHHPSINSHLWIRVYVIGGVPGDLASSEYQGAIIVNSLTDDEY
jgi:hypothetical protein